MAECRSGRIRHLGGAAEGDVITGVEKVVGSGHDDIFGGDGDNNPLDSGMGKDWLSGGSGADVLPGGQGADTLYGNDASGRRPR